MAPEVLTSLATQIPLVAAFIWLVMSLLKEFRVGAREQQAELQVFIDSQNVRWQQSLQVERERRKEAMEQGLREVQVLAGAIDKLAAAVQVQSETLMRHDSSAKERHDQLVRAIAEGMKRA